MPHIIHRRAGRNAMRHLSPPQAARIEPVSPPHTSITMPARLIRDRLEESFARIADPKGEGARACLTVYQATARLEADAADARARAGMNFGALDGAIVSIKDLFD